MRLDPNQVRQQISILLLTHPELAEDEVLRADMIEGSTDMHEFLRLVEKRRHEAKCFSDAIDETIVELRERQERFDRREEAMRALIMKIMEEAALRKVELPEATLSIRNGQQKLIGDRDPEKMDALFVRSKLELNRPAIKEALQNGAMITGFTLSNAEPTLSIRTK